MTFTIIKLRLIWSPSDLGVLPDLKQWCLSDGTIDLPTYGKTYPETYLETHLETA